MKKTLEKKLKISFVGDNDKELSHLIDIYVKQNSKDLKEKDILEIINLVSGREDISINSTSIIDHISPWIIMQSNTNVGATFIITAAPNFLRFIVNMAEIICIKQLDYFFWIF